MEQKTQKEQDREDLERLKKSFYWRRTNHVIQRARERLGLDLSLADVMEVERRANKNLGDSPQNVRGGRSVSVSYAGESFVAVLTLSGLIVTVLSHDQIRTRRKKRAGKGWEPAHIKRARRQAARAEEEFLREEQAGEDG